MVSSATKSLGVMFVVFFDYSDGPCALIMSKDRFRTILKENYSVTVTVFTCLKAVWCFSLGSRLN